MSAIKELIADVKEKAHGALGSDIGRGKFISRCSPDTLLTLVEIIEAQNKVMQDWQELIIEKPGPIMSWPIKKALQQVEQLAAELEGQ